MAGNLSEAVLLQFSRPNSPQDLASCSR